MFQKYGLIRIVGIVSLIFTGAVALVAGSQLSTIADAPLDDELVHQAKTDLERLDRRILEQNAAWTIESVAVDNRQAVGVRYDPTQAETILAYRESVRTHGADAFTDSRSEIPVLVTFTHPIDFAYFRAIVEDSGASVISYQIRALQSDGRRGTIGGAPTVDGKLLNPVKVDNLVDHQQQKREVQIDVQGVFEAEMVVDAEAYHMLTVNSDIFLVDVMRAVAVTAASNAGIQQINMANVELIAPYWYMEDLKMIDQ